MVFSVKSALPRPISLLVVTWLLIVLSASTASAAPINDNAANAVVIPVGFQNFGNNASATIEPGEQLTANDPAGNGCGADGTATAGAYRMYATVWWEFTGNGGPITVSTSGSLFDSMLGVYDQNTGALIGCNDDVGRFGTPDQRVTSEVTRPTIAGRLYSIQVGGCDASAFSCATPTTGDAAVRVASTPPNDDRGSATPVPASGVLAMTNTGGTLQSGEVSSCGALSPYAKTIWARYTAPAPGTATFSVSGINSVIAIYRGNSFTPVACNDDAIDGQPGASRVPQSLPEGPTFAVTPGDYFIQIGGYYDDGLTVAAARNGPMNLQVIFTADTDVDDDGFSQTVDCDDSHPGVHPGAVEIVNNDVDENCDGVAAVDADGDGYQSPPTGGDCRDDRADIHPGAHEVLGNGIDEDCDGADGVQKDRDDDGVLDPPYGPDCAPDNAGVRPGATEVLNNDVDENCDGIAAYDRDGDGVLAPPGGGDCRDDRANIRPGAVEVLGNGVDEDCDGSDGLQKDRDDDGVLDPPYGPDCAPTNAKIRPGATETPENDLDEDCDGKDGALRVLRASIRHQMRNFGSYTTVDRLAVVNAPARSSIVLRCTGQRCPFAKKTYPVARARDVSVLSRLRHRLRLYAGSIFEVRVVKTGYTGIARVYQIARGKRKPLSFQDLCVRRNVLQPCP